MCRCWATTGIRFTWCNRPGPCAAVFRSLSDRRFPCPARLPVVTFLFTVLHRWLALQFGSFLLPKERQLERCILPMADREVRQFPFRACPTEGGPQNFHLGTTGE